jgi:UDP-glucose 4-epimerase
MSTLLITGGTGTFGSAVVKRYLNDGRFDRINIFSRDEKKQEDMRIALNDKRVQFYLGDVRDASTLVAPMKNVDYVFHAAALKQVPSCEFFPLEATKTNVLGAENVFNAAIESGVKKVIALSTDKAVYPINAMGLSKAMMERVMVAKSRLGGTVFCGTRYGNVLASRGSVVPLFASQVREGKPITVTNPYMTRFMMTIDEAVDLVQHAFDNGEQGDIFVQKSPASNIHQIAEAVCEVLDYKVEIKIIGTRHGEKLYETLVSSEEMAHAESTPRYYRIRRDSRDLNYASYYSDGHTASHESYTSHNTRQLDSYETANLLRPILRG